jgi:outer membrane biosynthesis protein TonB
VRAPRPHQRRFILALVVSIALHTALFTLTKMKPPELVLAGSTPESAINVQLIDVQPAAPPESAPAQAQPQPAPTPPPPRPVPVPTVPVPRITRKSPTGTEPPPPPPEPQPPAPPTPRPPPIPELDMAAMIEARRAARQAQRESAQAAAPRPNMPPTPDQIAQAKIQRNLMMDRGAGVGGVFQILRKSTRTGEFAFNGWRPDTEKRWREVIEVDAGPGGDIERAMVQRMIELIRGHYTGDFRWDSNYLGRVVVLSARPEDQSGLEDFLMREFFGTPMEKVRR